MKYILIVVLVVLNGEEAFGVDLLNNMALNLAKNYAKNIIQAGGQTRCAADLNATAEALVKMKFWALKMFDASGKLPSGLLAGHSFNFGAYDECLKVRGSKGIRGKYCEARFNGAPERPGYEAILNVDKMKKLVGMDVRTMPEYQERFPFATAVCVPHSCSAEDLQTISDFADEKFNLRFYLRFDDALCFTDEPRPLDAPATLTLFFFVAVAVLMVASTVYDLQTHSETEHDRSELLLAFSVYTNAKSLFSSRREDESLAAVNGIRAMSMTWIVLGHTFMTNLFRPHTNLVDFSKTTRDFSTSIIYSAYLSVHTFLVISGLLVVYLYQTQVLNRGYSVSWGMYYFHRILRLTPSLLAMVLFYTNLFKYVGSGPIWYNIEYKYVAYCEKYWWSTMLYVQNYLNTNEECVTHSWYLAADTQLYFLAPLLLVGLQRTPTKSLLGVATLIFWSMVASYFVTTTKRIGSLPSEATSDFFSYFYSVTHMRIVSWLIGATWGYALYRSEGTKFELSKRTVAICWIVCWPTVVVMVLLSTILYRSEYNATVAGLYNSLTQPVWSMCVGWIIFACAKGYGGLINTFLSKPIFNVLARLSYTTYLVHMPILIAFNYQARVADSASISGCYLEFLSFYVISLFVAMFWSLAFEAPVRSLEKYAINKYGKNYGQKYQRLNKSPQGVKVI